MTRRSPRLLVIMAILALLSLTACSSPTTPAAEPDGATADLEFVRSMLVEHSRSLELARIAIARTSYLDMMEFATTIAATQAAEVEQLRSWLAARGRQNADPTLDPGVGRLSETQRQALDAVKGLQFDNVWMPIMIEQLRGSIEVAQAEIDHGRDPALVALARTIATTQQQQADGIHRIEEVPS